MFELPSKTYGLPDGSTPISKVSRVQRKSERAKKKAEEDAQIQAASKPKKKREAIPTLERRELFRRAKKCCEDCGKPGNPDEGRTLAIDHVLPVCQGGTNDIDNLRLLCNFCNGAKGGSRDCHAEAVARARAGKTVDNNRIVEQLAAIVGKKGKVK